MRKMELKSMDDCQYDAISEAQRRNKAMQLSCVIFNDGLFDIVGF
jgi:hypothetical protein